MPFRDDVYHPLDLERAALDQWGSAASVERCGEQLHDWRASVPVDDSFQFRSLDLRAAVAEQYGRDWALVDTGLIGAAIFAG